MPRTPFFAFDTNYYLVCAPGNLITGNSLKYLSLMLCSKTIFYALRKYYMGGGIEGELKTNRLLLLPVPLENIFVKTLIGKNIIKFTDSLNKDSIEEYIFSFYDFTEKEKEVINQLNFTSFEVRH